MSQVAGTGAPGDDESRRVTLADLALEREKVQIERERLALERERWAAERDRHRNEAVLRNRAAGRLTMDAATLALALLSALLAGGLLGAWLASSRDRHAGQQVATSLVRALGAETNAVADAESAALLRALRRPGRRGGYLLILE
jgi:hypothetical protein